MASIVAPVTKGRAQDVVGTRRVSYFRVSMSASYTTGGEAFDPKANGHIGDVGHVRISPRYAAGATGPINHVFMYDHTNKKIVALVGTTGVEVGAAVDLSGTVLDLEVFSN